MLRELAIRNFAIIDDLSISFEDGLSVLTGETGAGKSIIINAVNLILGGRASGDMIRSSEETAELEALFEVPVKSSAAMVAKANGVDISEGLLARRVIQKNGRHRIYVNGRLATTQILSSISGHLASIAGQHGHQNLLKNEHHLFVLDRFGGLSGPSGLCGQVRACYEEVHPLIRRLTKLRGEVESHAERRELLAFQVQEIDQADIAVGEDEALEQERERLKHAEHLYETVGRCVESLYGMDGAVVETTSSIGKELQSLCGTDASLSPVANRVETAILELEDVAGELQKYLQTVVFDTERLEALELRLDTLRSLKRKYGGTLASILSHREEAEQELKRVSSLPEKITETEKELEMQSAKLKSLCRKLSERRRKAARQLAKGVQKEVACLGMNKTRFKVSFGNVPVGDNTSPYLVLANGAIEATGIDRVEFLISPNVGEDLRPLVHIASGGELSRIVLALKAMLATKDAVETLIFDEVDAGIGGEVAEMVGEKLESLSRFHQVICITHLPQIARFGKNHFRINKIVDKGRTMTRIEPLNHDARVKELARMLGGGAGHKEGCSPCP